MDKVLTTIFKKEWLLVAAAALFMIGMPAILLFDDTEKPPKPNPLIVTHLEIEDVIVAQKLLEKPLFNEKRRPFVVEATPEPPPEPDEAAPVAPPPTLVGIVSQRRGKAVIIVKNNQGEAKTLTRGQIIDGWKLAAIKSDKAVFTQAGTTKSIGLDYSNKALGGPASPAPISEQNLEQTDSLVGEPN